MRRWWRADVSIDSRLREAIWTSTQQTPNKQKRQVLGRMERTTLNKILTSHSLVAIFESVSLPLPYRYSCRLRGFSFFTSCRRAPILLGDEDMDVEDFGINQCL